MEEALVNAIKHGNGSDPSKTVTVGFAIDADSIELTIRDQGEGFDPSTVPDPTTVENIQRPSGRGIMLMRAYMDRVDYADGGRTVRLLKHNPGKGDVSP